MRLTLLAILLVGCSGADVEAPPEALPSEDEVHTEHRPRGTDIWRLRSDHTLRTDIQRALAQARERGTRVLLEFGADWCDDCNEVARLLAESPAKDVSESDYEVVYIHVGRFDRHEDLLERYRVERIATLVVLSSDGRRVAQTTLEPISGVRGLTSEALAQWLRSPRDAWRRPEPAPGTPPPDDSPIFPPDVVPQVEQM